MEDLINKALNVEKDCSEMDKFAQLNYVAGLYERMAKTPLDQIEDMNAFCKAQEHVGNVWYCLAAECKESMTNKLKQRISTVPYGSLKESVGRNDFQIIEVLISNQFTAEVWYKWGTTIKISFLQHFRDGNNHDTMADVVVRWKIVPDWLKKSVKYSQGHFEKEVSINNWIDVALDTVEDLKNHEEEVIELCKKSSNIDNSGNLIKHYNVWKTKGRIVSVTKELPLLHVYHAKKSELETWDNSPYCHGSNGTYVENANLYWSLNLKVMRPSYEVPQPTICNIDIHNYITQSLMPKLRWARITQERLNRLNEILTGVKMELETSDTDKAAVYRNFKPVGFSGWNDYLDSIILTKSVHPHNRERYGTEFPSSQHFVSQLLSEGK